MFDSGFLEENCMCFFFFNNIKCVLNQKRKLLLSVTYVGAK